VGPKAATLCSDNRTIFRLPQGSAEIPACNEGLPILPRGFPYGNRSLDETGRGDWAESNSNVNTDMPSAQSAVLHRGAEPGPVGPTWASFKSAGCGRQRLIELLCPVLRRRKGNPAVGVVRV